MGKSESSRSPYDGLPQEIPKKADPSRPLKYQLPTKSWPSPPPPPDIGRPVSVPPSPANSEPSVVEGDWTELLSSADPASSLPRPNGGAKKPAALLSPVGKGVRGGSGGLVKPARRSDVAASEGETVKNVSGDREEPSASAGLRPSRGSSSFLDLTKELFKQEFQGGGGDHSRSLGSDIDSKKLDVKEGVEGGDDSKSRSNEKSKHAGIALRTSGSRDETRSSLESDEESSDSTSASDSDEEERQKREERRRRKEQIIAERIAAVAAEAIREREDIVARLEGEKQSLEKILEEREKKQAEEVLFLLCCLFFNFSWVWYSSSILFGYLLLLFIFSFEKIFKHILLSKAYSNNSMISCKYKYHILVSCNKDFLERATLNMSIPTNLKEVMYAF